MKSIIVLVLPLTLVFSNSFGQSPVFENTWEGFNLAHAVYAGHDEEFFVGDQEIDPTGLAFNNDGTKMYIIGSGSDVISEYDLGIAYDVSSASYNGIDEAFDLKINSNFEQPQDMEFNNDGTRLYVMFYLEGNSFIGEYDLSTGFDISSAVYNGAEENLGINNSIMNSPVGFAFNDDGGKLYVVQGHEGNHEPIQVYNLNVLFDVSTSVHSPNESSILAGQVNPELRDIDFNADGTKMFTTGNYLNMIMEYNLVVPYEISTAQYLGRDEALSVVDEQNEVENIAYSQNGLRLFVLGSSGNSVVEYQLPVSLEFTENATDTVIDINANDGQGGAEDSSVTYSLTGDDSQFFNINALGEITFLSTPNFENPDDEDNNNLYQINVVSDNSSTSSLHALEIKVIDEPDSPLFQTLDGGFTLAQAEYAGSGKTLHIGSQMSRPEAMNFNGDGSRLVTLDRGSDMLLEYVLSTPYDLSTAIFAGNEESFSIAEQEDNAMGFRFNNDGTKVYVIGAASRIIFTYDLNPAYDISSAVYDNSFVELNIDNGAPRNLIFSNDGSKMFIPVTGGGGSSEDVIMEYNLETAYDVSTAIHTGRNENFVLRDGLQLSVGISFNPDGSEMIISGYNGSLVASQSVLEKYDLKVPFDISSARSSEFDESLLIQMNYISIRDHVLNSDGSELFILNSAGNIVMKYILGSKTLYVENSTDYVVDINATDGLGGETDANVTFNLQGVDASYFSIDELGILTFSSPPDFESPQDEDSNNQYELSIVTQNSTDQSFFPLMVVVENEPDLPVFLDYGTGYDVSNANYYGVVNFHDELQGLSAVGLEFNTDGTKMYISTENNAVFEFTLSTAFNIESAICEGKHLLEDASTGMTFNNNGTKMFVLSDYDTYSVYTYDITEPYDISSAVYSGVDHSFYFGENESLPRDLAFSQDGSKMFILGQVSDAVQAYNLSLPFEVSTASFAGNDQDLYVYWQEMQSTAFHFNLSGTKIFVLGSSDHSVAEYELETPYDLSTTTYLGENEEFSVRTEVPANPSSFKFNNAGTKMFVLAYNREVVTYDLVPLIIYNELSHNPVYDIGAYDGMQGPIDSSVSYALSGVDGDQFRINTDGLLEFNATPEYSNPLDANADNIYEITVSAENTFEVSMVNLMIEVNSIPSFNTETYVVHDNSENGDYIGGPVATDEDGDTLIFSIESGNTNNVFQLTTDGDLHVFNSDQLNYELNTSFDLEVTVTDENGINVNGNLLIQLNRAPIFETQTFTIDKNSELGTEIGTISASDPDGDILTFSIQSENTNNAFQLNSDGTLLVNNKTELQHENITNLVLVVLVTDTNGGAKEAEVTIELSEILLVNGGQEELNNNLNVYPNPTKGKVWLDFVRNRDEEYVFYLTSMEGKRTRVVPFELNSSDGIGLDLQHFKAGIYIVSIIEGKEIYRSKRVVIKK